MKLPHRSRPCNDCPFRKDSPPLISLADRLETIARHDVHTCHKTQDLPDDKKLQCAGHMLVKGDENTFVQLATRFGYELNLSGADLVFDSVDSMIKHHRP